MGRISVHVELTVRPGEIESWVSDLYLLLLRVGGAMCKLDVGQCYYSFDIDRRK